MQGGEYRGEEKGGGNTEAKRKGMIGFGCDYPALRGDDYFRSGNLLFSIPKLFFSSQNVAMRIDLLAENF